MSDFTLDSSTTLPRGWRGSELFDAPDWDVELSSSGVRELLQVTETEPADRPCAPAAPQLPGLAVQLAAVQRGLEEGIGVTRLRGLPADLPEPHLARAFQALAQSIGHPLLQNAEGDTLLHVRDEGFREGDPRLRGPYTRRSLGFHTDRCDVIAFLCVRAARRGGENDVVSSLALFHELRRRHPDALEVLMQPFVYQRHTVDTGNPRAHLEQPIFSVHAGHFAASYLRVLIDRADRDPSLPDLNPEQRRALDVLDETADDPALYARFRQEPGDVILINNWVTLHRRSAFEDHGPAERRRHLMRLWLSVPNSRPLAPAFGDLFGATQAGALRGGMRRAR